MYDEVMKKKTRNEIDFHYYLIFNILFIIHLYDNKHLTLAFNRNNAVFCIFDGCNTSYVN